LLDPGLFVELDTAARPLDGDPVSADSMLLSLDVCDPFSDILPSLAQPPMISPKKIGKNKLLNRSMMAFSIKNE
jgi:hypothetical protein